MEAIRKPDLTISLKTNGPNSPAQRVIWGLCGGNGKWVSPEILSAENPSVPPVVGAKQVALFMHLSCRLLYGTKLDFVEQAHVLIDTKWHTVRLKHPVDTKARSLPNHDLLHMTMNQ